MIQEATLVGAFATGLIGATHCVGMCGAFAAGVAMRQGALGTITYTAGRITTYAALGALAGVVGQAMGWLGWVGWVLSAIFLVYFAARLAGLPTLFPKASGPLHRAVGTLNRRAGRAGPFIVGASTALLPCGLVYAALALPVATGSPLNGALAMAAFGLGTVPLLSTVAFGAFRLGSLGNGARRALAAMLLIAGFAAMSGRMPRPVEETGGEVAPCEFCDPHGGM